MPSQQADLIQAVQDAANARARRDRAMEALQAAEVEAKAAMQEAYDAEIRASDLLASAMDATPPTDV
jgi:hypothetical protein